MIQFEIDDIKINILETTSHTTDKEDFRLLIEYVSVLQDINNNLNQLQKTS